MFSRSTSRFFFGELLVGRIEAVRQGEDNVPKDDESDVRELLEHHLELDLADLEGVAFSDGDDSGRSGLTRNDAHFAYESQGGEGSDRCACGTPYGQLPRKENIHFGTLAAVLDQYFEVVECSRAADFERLHRKESLEHRDFAQDADEPFGVLVELEGHGVFDRSGCDLFGGAGVDALCVDFDEIHNISLVICRVGVGVGCDEARHTVL